ncbi:MAG: 4Fe-4S binding protein [Gemmataceae bacterium]|nr:4Fe-4S binding protein [Gemmataceae bacterium]
MEGSHRAKRSGGEWTFLVVFYTSLLGFYLFYKYPHWLLPEGADLRTFYLVGKSLGFWYNTLYTALVVGACLWVLTTGLNRYQWTVKKKSLSRYQRAKFLSILLAQLIAFYLLPFVLPGLLQEGGFWNDPPKVASKAAHVYVYPGFQGWGMAVYLFVVIPIAVWFFGKRYCSWFCACGNLAESVGVLPWGARWVRMHTPRGRNAERLEVIQVWVLAFALFFGVMLVLDGLKLFSAPSLLTALQGFQDLFIDFLFGSVVGIGAYPVLGTRVWCRYGCPLAGMMGLAGKWTRSPYAVVPSDKCKGLGLCTQVCPMGIDVASFAHQDKKPIQVRFGLDSTPCIGCGGCIDVCPVGALSFAPVGRLGPAIVLHPATAEVSAKETNP